jgi:hypothetical protein
MGTIKWLAPVVILLVAVQPSFAYDHAKLLGTWRLVSFEVESKATGEKKPLLGKNPTGYIIFTSEGRFMAILTGEGRKAPKTDQDHADLWKSMLAYTGIYRLEGDKWITKVDVSWTPAWVGTEQVRFFRVDGNRLQVTSAWAQAVLGPERGIVRGIITFERAK